MWSAVRMTAETGCDIRCQQWKRSEMRSYTSHCVNNIGKNLNQRLHCGECLFKCLPIFHLEIGKVQSRCSRAANQGTISPGAGVAPIQLSPDTTACTSWPRIKSVPSEISRSTPSGERHHIRERLDHTPAPTRGDNENAKSFTLYSSGASESCDVLLRSAVKSGENTCPSKKKTPYTITKSGMTRLTPLTGQQ